MSIQSSGVVLLCRYNSTRLPGKILIEINGKAILQHIIDRIAEVISSSRIVVACSSKLHDDKIHEYCEKNKINCFRGSLENVAERFYKASLANGWSYAVRINGDNLFLDKDLLKEMMLYCEEKELDFYSNVKDRTYPKGQSIEIVRTSFFGKHSEDIFKSPFHSEHVMTYFYHLKNHEKIEFRKNIEVPEAAGMQLAIDDAKDLKKAKYIFSRVKNQKKKLSLRDLVTLNQQFLDER